MNTPIQRRPAGATMPRLGAVVPTFNEAQNIAGLLSALLGLVPDAAIVVVDDSPDDSTVTAVTRLAAPNVEVIHREGKGGRGSAVLAGMRRLLTGDTATIVEMDADHSHAPQELPGLLQQAREEQLDLLIASRYLPDSRIERWPISRRILSRTANRLARTVLGVPVHDYTNGYRIYSRRAAELVTARCGRAGSGFIALSEILVAVHHGGMRIGERPTVFVNRARGESSLGARELASAAVGLWRTFLLRRRLESDRP
jgi:dolichol-phosphate mannosyltransferase